MLTLNALLKGLLVKGLCVIGLSQMYAKTFRPYAIQAEVNRLVCVTESDLCLYVAVLSEHKVTS